MKGIINILEIKLFESFMKLVLDEFLNNVPFINNAVGNVNRSKACTLIISVFKEHKKLFSQGQSLFV